jgi:hypothetical protein
VRWTRRALLVAVLLAFPFGPLFPWSIWKPGYEHLALTRADIYYPSGRPLPKAFRELDREIEESERFHQLRVRERIRVVLCRSWGDFHRFMPRKGYKPGAVTLQIGNVIYVTPRVDERGFDHGEFLRHELSHATLHQNQGWLAAIRSNDAEPFIEGLACSFGRMTAFKTPHEVVTWVSRHDVGPVVDPAQRTSRGDMGLNYSVWRFFLEYMVERRGRDRFQQVMLGTMREPSDYPAVFQRVYGTPLSVAAWEFQEAVRAGRWKPRG